MGNTNKNVKETIFATSNPNFNKAKIIEEPNRKYIQATFKSQVKEFE